MNKSQFDINCIHSSVPFSFMNLYLVKTTVLQTSSSTWLRSVAPVIGETIYENSTPFSPQFTYFCLSGWFLLQDLSGKMFTAYSGYTACWYTILISSLLFFHLHYIFQLLSYLRIVWHLCPAAGLRNIIRTASVFSINPHIDFIDDGQ